MHAEFWHQMWESKDIGFHEAVENSFLVRYFDNVIQGNKVRVKVPLCGKTLDIHWLLAQGHQVVGAELNQTAVKELFEELGVEPQLTEHGELTKYSATNIDIFLGDIFALTKAMLGPVDVIYDRAALVALPFETRTKYAKHLIEITDNAPQLLVVYEYDQTTMDGPPFSIASDEINRLYNASYTTSHLDSKKVEEGVRGTEATEHVWLLER